MKEKKKRKEKGKRKKKKEKRKKKKKRREESKQNGKYMFHMLRAEQEQRVTCYCLWLGRMVNRVYLDNAYALPASTEWTLDKGTMVSARSGTDNRCKHPQKCQSLIMLCKMSGNVCLFCESE